MKKNTMMTEGPIWRQILFFSIPLILGNLLQQLYNTVDSIIVGNYIGRDALAAVGATGSIIYLLIGFCVGASAGAGVVIAQYYGAGDKQSMEKAVHTTLAIAILSGLVLTVVGILFTPQILRWMGTPKAVMDQAALYLKIYFGGIIFNIIYNMSAGILNAVGNSRKALVYLAIAAVSNMVLDWVFVVKIHMGVEGVALATDISQLLSSVFIIYFLVKSNDLYHLDLKKIHLHKTMALKIIRIGIPTGIQNIVISFSNVVIQSSVNSFGPVAMAGFASYLKVDGFNILPVMSFSMAATTFTGQNVGAGKIDRVKKGMWISIFMGVIYTITTGILLLTFGEQVISIFTNDRNVIEYGAWIMTFFCPYYFTLAVMHILAGTIRGTGKTLEPMLIILMALCAYRVFWIKLIVPLFEGMHWVYMAYPISWMIGAIGMIVYAWKGKWMPKSTAN